VVELKCSLIQVKIASSRLYMQLVSTNCWVLE